MYFEYTQAEMDYLSEKDLRLGNCIRQMGYIKREMQPDLFCGICMQLISQQISTRAAATVFERLKQRLLNNITPQALLECDNLDGVGLSKRKQDNLRFAAKTIFSGEISLERLQGETDEEAVNTLTALPGVGVWTAQMLLLFTLGRKNIISFGDYGIKCGLKLLYGCEAAAKSSFEKYQRLYSPYSSVASIYLWEAARLYGLNEKRSINEKKL